MNKNFLIFFITFLGPFFGLNGQDLPNKRQKKIPVQESPVKLDTLSIVPGSAQILINEQKLDTTQYDVDVAKSQIHWNKPAQSDSAIVRYRVLPYNLSQKHYRKSTDLIDTPGIDYEEKAEAYKPQYDTREDFGFNQLNKNGSIARGVSFGNEQDLSLNSNLDLQVTGRLTENVDVKASVTDQNIPIQPEGNTARLQEFDKVFIELEAPHDRVRLGDIQMEPLQDNYFMDFYKKSQGISYQRKWKPNEAGKLTLGSDLGFARGVFARNEFNGREGDQGPYQLKGNNNERFIIIVPGTEVVYLNGDKLKRGAQNDYTIDYNQGELTFTPENTITQYDRIVVEFQYSTRNYQRSQINGYGKYETEKWAFETNVLSQQDNKNQPLFQELSDDDERLLSSVGDSVDQALSPSFDTADYSPNRIMYKQLDTLGYENVFEQTNNPDSARFLVNFTDVGQGNGNYKLKLTDANGRIYEWVKPINGQPQGRYAPVEKLVAPEQTQLATVGITHHFSENTEANIELAASQKDVNTFSDQNDQDDQGLATFAEVNHESPLSSKKDPWTLETSIDFEHKTSNFNPIERYRPVEFNRQWNRQLSNTKFQNQNKIENLGNVSVGIEKKDFLAAGYEFGSFLRGDNFDGWSHRAHVNLDYQNFHFKGSTDFTDVSIEEENVSRENNFSVQDLHLSRDFAWLTLGTNYHREVTKHGFKNSSLLDSTSFRYIEWEVFAENPDTFRNNYRLSFTRRNDFIANQENFAPSSTSDNISLKTQLIKDPNHQLNWKIKYRIFNNKDTVTDQKNQNAIMNRLETKHNFLDNFIETRIYYQIGTGKERKTEYQFVKVRGDGQGNYVWEDFNNNGTQELNEFKEATTANKHRADYIRIVTPTDKFIKSISNEYNQSLSIDFGSIIDRKDGVSGFLSKLSNETSYRSKKKTVDQQTAAQYNPFTLNAADSNLITVNSDIQNSVYFNKSNPVYELSFKWLEKEGKRLLLRGFDRNIQNEKAFKARWNITRRWTIIPSYNYGFRSFNSQFFKSKDYNIHYNKTSNRFSFQPTQNLRFSIDYTYEEHEDLISETNDNAFINEIRQEATYSLVSKGNITGSFSYKSIKYNGDPSSQTAYEILKGLEPGSNFTWNVRVNYNIHSNLQLNLSYNGRKSQDISVIHRGNASVRYLF